MGKTKENKTRECVDSYYSVEDSYKRVRDKVVHEDDLVHQRLTWLITLNGLLFSAFSFALMGEGNAIETFESMTFNSSCKDIIRYFELPIEVVSGQKEPSQNSFSVRRACEFTDNLNALRQAIILSGIGSSIAAYIGIFAAFRRISNERVTYYQYLSFIRIWLHNKDGILDEKKREILPWIPRLTGHKFTNWLGMSCGMFVPIIIGVAWGWIGWEELDIVTSGVLLFATFVFVFLGLYCTLENHLAEIVDMPELYTYETTSARIRYSLIIKKQFVIVKASLSTIIERISTKLKY